MPGEAKPRATDAVVDFIMEAKLETFPADVLAQGTRCIIDGLGVILAGSASRASSIVRGHVRGLGGNREATVLAAEPFAAPASLAARANATSGHADDFDDTQLSASPDRIFGLLTHPTTPVLAASLALAERAEASGSALLEAFLTGFEVECKIAEAIRPEHYQRGFHTSGTIGTFGAAAGAAKLLRLDRREATMAIGTAASMAAGIRAAFGTMTKALQVGRAAENGVLAAELAGLGHTADPAALDGPWGFFQVLAGGFDAEKIIGVLGNPHTIVKPGVSVKSYPCGSLAQPSADALLELLVEHDVHPEEIERIRVRAGSNILEPLRYGVARSDLEAKFSLPFIMASMALRRRAGIPEFTDDFVLSRPVQRMMERVDVVRDVEIEARGFDRIRSVVELRLSDGRFFARSAEVYRGGPEHPFTREELFGKFSDCASAVLPPARVEEVFALVERLAEVASVQDLVRRLAPEKERARG